MPLEEFGSYPTNDTTNWTTAHNTSNGTKRRREPEGVIAGEALGPGFGVSLGNLGDLILSVANPPEIRRSRTARHAFVEGVVNDIPEPL
jgi:hypothetical protein